MTEINKKVQDYKDNLTEKAEHLVLNGFPEKIVELNELLTTPMFSKRNFNDFHKELNIPVPEFTVTTTSDTVDAQPSDKKPRIESCVPGTKVMALPSKGSIPCHGPLCEMILIVKPIIRTLVEDSNLIKMWIAFMVPKIEDGNNFGVAIQEDTLAEIQNVEYEAAEFFDQISQYFLLRAKIISKVSKYPHVDDYRRGVDELDESEYLKLWLIICEVRNRYSLLHDIVTKNLEKLKTPRSTAAHESLY